MNKSTDVSTWGKRLWDGLLRRHQSIIVFICIFLLLFLGGYRFNIRNAAIFSFVDALYLMFFYDICTLIHRYFEKKKKYHKLSMLRVQTGKVPSVRWWNRY